MSDITVERIDELETIAQEHLVGLANNDMRPEDCRDILSILRDYRRMRVIYQAPVISFTHWSKDPLVPYLNCGCISCVAARNVTVVTTNNTGAVQP